MADDDVDLAIKHYRRSIELYAEDEQQAIFIGDTWRQCLNLMVKHDKKEDALSFLDTMFPIFEMLGQAEYLHKAQLSAVILHLAKGDSVAAANARDSFREFAMSDEGEAASDLIDAFEEGNEEAIRGLVTTQTFTLLENQVGRLASKLPEICTECASDMTGARSNTRKVAPAVKADSDDDGAAGGGAGAGSAAAADPEDDMDDLM
mmetsp:Transcript_39176/g.79063  ORF Transcript_39176/g.79063 Transcript_39176/m.79063 type:complete len:205 (-) Transcript_39176:48-662(-)